MAAFLILPRSKRTKRSRIETITITNHLIIFCPNMRHSKPGSSRSGRLLLVKQEERGGPMSVLKATCPRCRTEVDTATTADEHTLHECGEIGV